MIKLSKIKRIDVNLLINISLGLILANIIYFFGNLLAISTMNTQSVDTIILNNPLLAIDLLASCGKLWIGSVLISIRNNRYDSSKELVNCWLFLLICSQLLMLNYLLVISMSLVWYSNHGEFIIPKISFQKIFTSKITFILLLYLFISFVNLRILFFS